MSWGATTFQTGPIAWGTPTAAGSATGGGENVGRFYQPYSAGLGVDIDVDSDLDAGISGEGTTTSLGGIVWNGSEWIIGYADATTGGVYRSSTGASGSFTGYPSGIADASAKFAPYGIISASLPNSAAGPWLVAPGQDAGSHFIIAYSTDWGDTWTTVDVSQQVADTTGADVSNFTVGALGVSLIPTANGYDGWVWGSYDIFNLTSGPLTPTGYTEAVADSVPKMMMAYNRTTGDLWAYDANSGAIEYPIGTATSFTVPGVVTGAVPPNFKAQLFIQPADFNGPNDGRMLVYYRESSVDKVSYTDDSGSTWTTTTDSLPLSAAEQTNDLANLALHWLESKRAIYANGSGVWSTTTGLSWTLEDGDSTTSLELIGP